MQRRLFALLTIAALFVTLIGFTQFAPVQAATSCSPMPSQSGFRYVAIKTPLFAVNAGDIITATVSATADPSFYYQTTVGVHVYSSFDSVGQTFTASVRGTAAGSVTWTASASGCITVAFVETTITFTHITWSVTVGQQPAAGTIKPLFTDGRENKWSEQAAQPFAAYCNADGGVSVYAVKDSKGTLAFTATKADLDAVPAKPAKNTLIKQAMDIALYRLTTGELQLNSQGYVFTWKGC